MDTYPLTPQGAEDFQTELYAMTPSEIEDQADDIAADFKTYMKDHFNLTTDQEDFVDGMSRRVATYYGALCAICFEKALTINLVYPAPPGPGYGKWTGSEDEVETQCNKLGDWEATGSVTFTMSYRL